MKAPLIGILALAAAACSEPDPDVAFKDRYLTVLSARIGDLSYFPHDVLSGVREDAYPATLLVHLGDPTCGPDGRDTYVHPQIFIDDLPSIQLGEPIDLSDPKAPVSVLAQATVDGCMYEGVPTGTLTFTSLELVVGGGSSNEGSIDLHVAEAVTDCEGKLPISFDLQWPTMVGPIRANLCDPEETQ